MKRFTERRRDRRKEAAVTEKAPQGNELVPVETVPGRFTAEVRKALLESYGIPVFFRSQSIMSWRSVDVGPMGEVSLMVPASRAGEARQILETVEAEDLGADEGENGREFRARAREAASEAEAKEWDPHP